MKTKKLCICGCGIDLNTLRTLNNTEIFNTLEDDKRYIFKGAVNEYHYFKHMKKLRTPKKPKKIIIKINSIEDFNNLSSDEQDIALNTIGLEELTFMNKRVLCACGCEKRIPYKPYHLKQGRWAKFLPGHNNTLRKGKTYKQIYTELYGDEGEEKAKSIIEKLKKSSKGGFAGRSNIGKNETFLLDNIEEEQEIRLERQFPVAGKFVDGYDAIHNIAYEVDEKHHKGNKENDIIREQEIINKLGCIFVRIKDGW